MILFWFDLIKKEFTHYHSIYNTITKKFTTIVQQCTKVFHFVKYFLNWCYIVYHNFHQKILYRYTQEMKHKNWNITILSNFILLPLTTINFFCTYTHEQIFKVEPNALNYHTTSSLLTGRRWCQKYCIGENYRKTNQKQLCPIKQSFFNSKIATFFLQWLQVFIIV